MLGGFEQATNSSRKKSEITHKRGNGQLQAECGFVQRMTPQSLFRDTVMRMNQIPTHLV